MFFGAKGVSGESNVLDDRQITHLICVRLRHLLYDFFRGCLGPQQEGGPRHPLKKSYSKRLRRTQIRRVNLAVVYFWMKGMRRSTFQWKKLVFGDKGGGNSVNQGFGKDFFTKGNSVKSFGPFSEPLDSANCVKLLSSFPSQKSALSFCRVQLHARENRKYPRISGAGVDLALRAPQPRGA